jgi:hypothetical protein
MRQIPDYMRNSGLYGQILDCMRQILHCMRRLMDCMRRILDGIRQILDCMIESWIACAKSGLYGRVEDQMV